MIYAIKIERTGTHTQAEKYVRKQTFVHGTAVSGPGATFVTVPKWPRPSNMPGAERHIKVLTKVWVYQVFKCLATMRVMNTNLDAEKVIRSQIVYQ